MVKDLELAELQLAIMHVLWDCSQATVGEVRERLAGKRSLAHTTIATMLTKMEAKGYVKHKMQGRKLVYRAIIARDSVSRSMVRGLLKKLFGGDVTQLVNCALGTSHVTQETLDALKTLIREHEKDRRCD